MSVPTKKRTPIDRSRTVKLSDAQHWQIIRLHAAGYSTADIAAVTKLHAETIIARIKDGFPAPDYRQRETVRREAREGARCSGCGAWIVTQKCVACELREWQRVMGAG